jgi:hypothetical protein
MNPRGALYALMNCPFLIFCPRGVVQLFSIGSGVCFTHGCVMTGLFVVHIVVVGVSVVFIFPSLLNSAPAFTGAVGWIYSFNTF